MNINSHVQLPNCVLRNFRDETDPEKKVWYLDVQTGDILRKSSKKLGTCKGYYSETGERFWAENIENPLSIITHRIQKYCTGEIPCLQISADDADACKRYIKAAFIRSKMAEDEMNKHSVTASICTEQSNHDMLACFGLRSYGPIESDLEKMDVSVLINKTERMLVVPRNCFYLVTLQGASHMVAPVCPKGAILLMPREMACAGMTAVVSDPNVIEEMNIWALCSELEFNSAFVAANRRIELESLRHELTSRHDTCSSIV